MQTGVVLWRENRMISPEFISSERGRDGPSNVVGENFSNSLLKPWNPVWINFGREVNHSRSFQKME